MCVCVCVCVCGVCVGARVLFEDVELDNNKCIIEIEVSHWFVTAALAI